MNALLEAVPTWEAKLAAAHVEAAKHGDDVDLGRTPLDGKGDILAWVSRGTDDRGQTIWEGLGGRYSYLVMYNEASQYRDHRWFVISEGRLARVTNSERAKDIAEMCERDPYTRHLWLTAMH